MAEIVLYSKQSCPYCTLAKSLLNQKGQVWTEIDIETESGRREEMIERSGRRTVPQIFIGDRHIGGFDDLKALDERGELDPLLERKATTGGVIYFNSIGSVRAGVVSRSDFNSAGHSQPTAAMPRNNGGIVSAIVNNPARIECHTARFGVRHASTRWK